MLDEDEAFDSPHLMSGRLTNSQRSRSNLLATPSDGLDFERISHTLDSDIQEDVVRLLDIITFSIELKNQVWVPDRAAVVALYVKDRRHDDESEFEYVGQTDMRVDNSKDIVFNTSLVYEVFGTSEDGQDSYDKIQASFRLFSVPILPDDQEEMSVIGFERVATGVPLFFDTLLDPSPEPDSPLLLDLEVKVWQRGALKNRARDFNSTRLFVRPKVTDAATFLHRMSPVSMRKMLSPGPEEELDTYLSDSGDDLELADDAKIQQDEEKERIRLRKENEYKNLNMMKLNKRKDGKKRMIEEKNNEKQGENEQKNKKKEEMYNVIDNKIEEKEDMKKNNLQLMQASHKTKRNNNNDNNDNNNNNDNDNNNNNNNNNNDNNDNNNNKNDNNDNDNNDNNNNKNDNNDISPSIESSQEEKMRNINNMNDNDPMKQVLLLQEQLEKLETFEIFPSHEEEQQRKQYEKHEKHEKEYEKYEQEGDTHLSFAIEEENKENKENENDNLYKNKRITGLQHQPPPSNRVNLASNRRKIYAKKKSFCPIPDPVTEILNHKSVNVNLSDRQKQQLEFARQNRKAALARRKEHKKALTKLDRKRAQKKAEQDKRDADIRAKLEETKTFIAQQQEEKVRLARAKANTSISSPIKDLSKNNDLSNNNANNRLINTDTELILSQLNDIQSALKKDGKKKMRVSVIHMRGLSRDMNRNDMNQDNKNNKNNKKKPHPPPRQTSSSSSSPKTTTTPQEQQQQQEEQIHHKDLNIKSRIPIRKTGVISARGVERERIPTLLPEPPASARGNSGRTGKRKKPPLPPPREKSSKLLLPVTNWIPADEKNYDKRKLLNERSMFYIKLKNEQISKKQMQKELLQLKSSFAQIKAENARLRKRVHNTENVARNFRNKYESAVFSKRKGITVL